MSKGKRRRRLDEERRKRLLLRIWQFAALYELLQVADHLLKR